MRIFILFIALCISPAMMTTAYAQDPEGIVTFDEEMDQPAASNGATPVADASHMLRKIENEFWYIVLLSVLCITTLLIVLYFLKDHSARDIVNATGLTLIIFGTIILVMVVSTSEQLTAAIGILGAIAGYLFRSVQESGDENNANA